MRVMAPARSLRPQARPVRRRLLEAPMLRRAAVRRSRQEVSRSPHAVPEGRALFPPVRPVPLPLAGVRPQADRRAPCDRPAVPPESARPDRREVVARAVERRGAANHSPWAILTGPRPTLFDGSRTADRTTPAPALT